MPRVESEIFGLRAGAAPIGGLAGEDALAQVQASGRLAALDNLAILDTPAETRFDDAVRLATRLCAAPVALVSLVATDRQWFKARIGFPACETDLNSSVCKFALAEPDLLIIPDLTADPRTAANPLVTGEPKIRFYAGAPLRLSDGQVVGSLCVIDTKARRFGLTEEQADDLRALGRQVSDQLETRRAVMDRDQALGRQRAEIRQARRIDVLAKVSQALLNAANPAAVLDQILTANAEILGFDHSYIYDVWPESDHLRLTHSLNATAEVQDYLRRMPFGAPLCGIVAEQRAPLVLTGLQESPDPRFQNAREIGLDAYAGFPVLCRGRIRGVISFASTQAPAFDDEALSFFETLARLMSAVHERLDGEKALRESEALAHENVQRVQLALEAGAIIGTWLWDIPNDRFTVDEAFAQSFGLDPKLGREGIPLADIVATVHPDDQAELSAAIEQAIRKGGAYAHQYRVRRADGRYYWIEANGRVDLADDGTPLTFPGVLLDVEERRAAREALRASEERFRTILSTIETAFAIVEVKFDADDRPVDYRFVEANGAFERQAGVNLRGKWVTEFAPDLEQFWFDTYGRVALTGEPANFENYAEAFKRWFDVKAVRVGKPEDRRIAIFFSDVSERRDAQKKLRESESRFRALVTAGAQTVYRMSPDWQEMRALDGAGFLADIDAPSVRWLDLYIDPADRPDVLAAIENAIVQKETFELEHRVRQADGAFGWTLSRAVPILSDSGEILEWFGAASDVTDRRAAEEERNLFQQELSHRLKNTFAMVLSIAGQTLRSVSERPAVEAFEQRIHALSSAHDVLLHRNWAAAPAKDVVKAVLTAAGHADRVDVRGPNLDLGARATLSLSLLLHELTTNAAKYGALSVPSGRIVLEWRVVGEGDDCEVVLTWVEEGGPPITPPQPNARKGFGSRLISVGLVGTGAVELRYPPSGFQATMRAPLYQLQRS